MRKFGPYPYHAVRIRRFVLTPMAGLVGGVLVAGPSMAQNQGLAESGLKLSLELSSRTAPVRQKKKQPIRKGESLATAREQEAELALKLSQALAVNKIGGGALVVAASSTAGGSNPKTGDARPSGGATVGGSVGGSPVPGGQTSQPSDDSDEDSVEPVTMQTQQRRQVERKVEDQLPDLSGESWRLAPITWGGSSTRGFNYSRDGAGNSTLGSNSSTSLSTSTYIFQPWLAQVTANGTLSSLSSTSSPADGSDPLKSKGTSYSLGGALSLFPMSHFPSQAYLDYGSGVSKGGTTTSEFSSTRFGVRQSYRPLGSNDNYFFTYDRTSFDAASTQSVFNNFSGNYSTLIGEEHSISAVANYAQTGANLNGESSSSFSSSANHVWNYEEGLNIASGASFGHQQSTSLVGRSLEPISSQVYQANSNISWQPYDEDDEPLPMLVSGGVNLLHLQSNGLNNTNQLTLVSAQGGTNYRFTDQLNGAVSAQTAFIQSNGTMQSMLGGSGSLSYAGLPIMLSDYVYTWSVGGGSGFSYSSSADPSASASANFGHALSRGIDNLSLSASQSVSANFTQGYGILSTLSHTGTASWQLRYGDHVSGYFSGNASHNMTTGDYGGNTLTFSLMGSGQSQLSRRSSVGVGANLMWSKQMQQQQASSPSLLVLGDRVIDTNQSQLMGSANVTYNHVAPFSISNLGYSASFFFSSAQSYGQQTFVGNPTTDSRAGWVTSKSFSQNANYRLGRLNFQVVNVFTDSAGQKNVILYGQVTRNFGDF